MAKRRNNWIGPNQLEELQGDQDTISLAEAKTMFLRDIRGLAKQTQRWHKENLNALEKVLARQGIEVTYVATLSAKFLKENFVYVMHEEMGLKVNTVNGRVRSLRALIKFLSNEGHIRKDFGADIPLLKGKKVIIETFSEEQLTALLKQPDKNTFTGLRDYTLMLLLIETGIRVLPNVPESGWWMSD